jgi:hypothetical protein
MAMLTTTTPGNFSTSKTSVVLLKDNAALPAISFSWTNPNMGAQIAFKNQLQIALKGTNFANPKSVDLAQGTSTISYNVQDFNAIMLALGLPLNGSSTDLETRIKSTAYSLDGSATTLPTSYSQVLNLTVTPYALVSYIYAPGAYQGWNPPTANTLTSATSNNIYIGYIGFTAANTEFKLTPVRTWDNSYGSTGGNNVTYNGGNNLKAPNAGMQKLTVDLNANTYTLIPYQISIIGSVTPGGNWSTDIDMTWDDAKSRFTGTAVFLGGEFKFRLNHDWNQTNWGGSNGVASTGGGNIPMTAGTHTVTYDPATLAYTIN